jgi:purine-nucleoside phosphorylase
VERAIEQAGETFRRLAGPEAFELAIVLGSGLGTLADELEAPLSISYRDLCCFPTATVSGHAGRLVGGTLQGCRTLFFQGRHHLYEGYDARQVTVSVRLARQLGCRRLLLTNAVGAVNRAFRAGDFMFIDDHINLMGDNPLRGETENPFVDLSTLYNKALFPPLLEFARQQGIGLHRGVLAALPGPSYETPAEIRMLRLMGADAVSMSTVPEAIMGKYLGLEVAGLSFVSNMAAGLAPFPLAHDEVLDAGRRAAESFSSLVRRLILLWRGEGDPGIDPAGARPRSRSSA